MENRPIIKLMKRHLQVLLATILCLGKAAGLQAWQPAVGPLQTRWTSQVSPQNALPEYPRPQMVRKEWLNLNGVWGFEITSNDTQPTTFATEILVPFPVESALSGVMKPVDENQRLWYRRTFDIPRAWIGRRILLHFGAVDFETTVFVNGKMVGKHRGGYDGFEFDITDSLNPPGENELVVSVWDPTDSATQPRGKQVRKPNGIWYTSTSGIWQTVWLEPVSAAHVAGLLITPDIDNNQVLIFPKTTANLGGLTVEAVVHDSSGARSSASGTAGEKLVVPIKNLHLWSPESPYLYSLTVTLKLGSRTMDRVECCVGMRISSLGKDARGFTRIMLNCRSWFRFGPLGWGFWT